MSAWSGGQLSVGVAMATHNGERYLSGQLDSLAKQIRIPDELIVCDDCSEDSTAELVERFAQTSAFPVRLLRSDSRLGYAQAFLEAARATGSDLVAFCDQDDLWKPEKLERCVAEFERHPGLTMLVHSAALFGETRARGLRHPAYRRKRILGPDRSPIMPRMPGFAMLASRRTVDPWEIIVRPSEFAFGWDHDDWTATIASAVGDVAFLPDQLVLYRQHEGNVWGAPGSGVASRLRVSMRYHGEEEEWFREAAMWARDHVRLLDDLSARAQDLRGVTRDGPAIKAKAWARLAAANELRADLYAAGTSVTSMPWNLMRSAAVGNYGPRARGGLGIASFGRDVAYALGVLNLLSTRRSHS